MKTRDVVPGCITIINEDFSLFFNLANVKHSTTFYKTSYICYEGYYDDRVRCFINTVVQGETTEKLVSR